MRSLRPLTQQERDALENQMKQTKEISEWKRLFVLLNYDEGQSIEELSRLTRLSKWTLETYLKEYSSRNKIKNDPRGGGSSKLTEEETKQLEQHLTNTTYLKVKSIVTYVNKTFDKQYSRSGMTDWLISHGFSFKNPGKLDPEKQEPFIREYEKLKRSLDPNDALVFSDAVHAECQSQAVYGWIKKGECKTLQTAGKQKQLSKDTLSKPI